MNSKFVTRDNCHPSLTQWHPASDITDCCRHKHYCSQTNENLFRPRSPARMVPGLKSSILGCHCLEPIRLLTHEVKSVNWQFYLLAEKNVGTWEGWSRHAWCHQPRWWQCWTGRLKRRRWTGRVNVNRIGSDNEILRGWGRRGGDRNATAGRDGQSRELWW